WQKSRLDPAMDGPWSDGVVFPYTAADGHAAAWTDDHRLVCDGRTITRTVTGVTAIALPGTIPGWRVYDDDRLFGLDPAVWYPYSDAPRDPQHFHVAALPEGFRVTSVVVHDDLASVRTEQTQNVLVDVCALFQEAVCRSEPYKGEPHESKGDLTAPDGGAFTAEGDVLHAHPPWKTGDTGEVSAQLSLDVPPGQNLRFVSDVAMDAGAVRENGTDGVTYCVTARAGDAVSHTEVHNATDQHSELFLDLTPFAGQRIMLELRATPGPNRNPSFDWARWYRPRIEQDRSGVGELTVAGDTDWVLALSGHEAQAATATEDRIQAHAQFPGAVYLLKATPKTVALPLDMASASFRTTFLDGTGRQLDSPLHARATPGESTVGGVKKSGLFTHPPNQGRTVVDFALTLPEQPVEFHSFVGLRDGGESEGVVFSVEV
ncbi:MAG: hypothetical protein GY851_01190, partial [bacterium]|nr:hypothetical protein [bacterium]